MRELELQSTHLGRMIKASQARKSLLDALLADINYIDAARSTAELGATSSADPGAASNVDGST